MGWSGSGRTAIRGIRQVWSPWRKPTDNKNGRDLSGVYPTLRSRPFVDRRRELVADHARIERDEQAGRILLVSPDVQAPVWYRNRRAAYIERLAVEGRCWLADVDHDVLDRNQTILTVFGLLVEDDFRLERVEHRIDQAIVYPVKAHAT